ncbi:MAG: hypothetical protein ACAH59_06435 [Pseudobdellovibrionaceae bacterium]
MGLLALLVPLFQNMSLLEDGAFDIREVAPQKPSGDWNSPYSDFFPKNMSARSLEDMERDLLSHHFDPLLKDLELTYLRGSDLGQGSPGQPTGSLLLNDRSEEISSRWKVSLVNPTRMRFSYDNFSRGKEFNITCEAQPGQEGLSLTMNRPLSTKLSWGITHETGQRQSQIQMDYAW